VAEGVLAKLAIVLPRLQALVLWAPGWAEADAVLALGHHDPELGRIDVLVTQGLSCSPC
jgi:hypothetical protein